MSCQLPRPALVLIGMSKPSVAARRLCVLAAACAALLALPGTALAGRCAPPGVSGVSQYYETVPGSGCNLSVGGGGSSHHGGGSLPAGTAGQLGSQGGAGQAVLALVRATGTAPGSAGRRGRTHSGRAGAGAAAKSARGVRVPQASGSSPVSALLRPLGGGQNGGLGVLLPVLLGLALVAVMLTVVLRRRRMRLGAK
jgi:hypothetical protein